MKKLYTLLSIMMSLLAFAQAPQGFNYQATVRNSAGVLIVNQNVNFKFNVMLNSQTSVPIYSEIHFAPTDDLGQVNLVIGQGTATAGTFSSINWANGSYYLGIEINTGSGYVAMGTTQLLSVPYALYANSSGNSNFNFPNGTNIGDTLNWIWNGSAWVPTSSTSSSQLPVISTIVATNTLTPSPSSGGTITSDGGFSITSKGVCWSTSPNPTIINNSTNNGTGASNFTSILSSLLPTTTYYYRAYATNSVGTGYGITYTFITAANPQVNTAIISAVTSSTASSGGTISSDGGATITAKGVCWSTSPNPTVALTTKTNNGTGTATFASSITGLLPITTYYVRAYATNSIGTAYGQEEVFTTLASLPTLTTTVASAITSSTASSGGTISSDGGATIINRGIVWSSTTNPTTATNQGITSNGNGIGTFTSALTQLTPGTLYYVRAYATNSGGTAYGNQITFSALPILPSISTTTISAITRNTASSGGTISSDGGATITAKGVCWSTSPNPTVALTTKTNNGTGTATFASSITGLLPTTTYYVRAYATNSVGTSYGNEINFITATLLTIGTQIWSPENSDVTTYRDGTPIPQVTTASEWGSLQTGAWCYYNNDPVIGATYGKLYNWYAIMGIYDSASLTNPSLRKQFAPVGWHVPTDAEWTTLTTFLGGESVAGSSLKETGTSHWQSPNSDATNSSGFTALPGGGRSWAGTGSVSFNIYSNGYFWTSTQLSTPNAWCRYLFNNSGTVLTQDAAKTTGFSVRCVKD